MNIILNNRDESFDTEKMTVSQLFEFKNFTFKLKVVKINGVLVKKDNYDNTQINEGDKVEMHYLMSGG